MKNNANYFKLELNWYKQETYNLHTNVHVISVWISRGKTFAFAALRQFHTPLHRDPVIKKPNPLSRKH